LSPKRFEPFYLNQDVKVTSYACRERKTRRRAKHVQQQVQQQIQPSEFGDSFLDSTLGKSQLTSLAKKMDVIAENPYNPTLPKFTMNSKSSIKIPEDKRYSIPP